jgi:NAD(P)-dependent dehydrogenase (short-subunit alcohol dehydrogenase family)
MKRADFDFRERIFLITGGASGIGEATARAFAEMGASGLIVDRNADGAQVAGELSRHHEGNVQFIQADITKLEDLQQTIAHVSEFGKLDILINNAAITDERTGASFEASSDAYWQESWEVNLFATVRLSRLALPLLRQSRGTIINVSSVHSVIGRNAATYSTTKAALNNLTQKLAVELGSDGIRVNAVVPGWIRTKGVEYSFADEAAATKALQSMTALKREGHPEEIASVILFLASSLASYMTGSIVVADGGWLSI